MKKLSYLLIAVICMMVAGIVAAQAQSIERAVDLRWQTEGAEPDVQYYQLYSGDSDTTLEKFGDPIFFNPNDPAAPEQITHELTIAVPAGEVVTRWFSVSAIDTSGNESPLAVPVSVNIDNIPPTAPSGFTVTIKIVITP
jgi:hypothetical protein